MRLGIVLGDAVWRVRIGGAVESMGNDVICRNTGIPISVFDLAEHWILVRGRRSEYGQGLAHFCGAGEAVRGVVGTGFQDKSVQRGGGTEEKRQGFAVNTPFEGV